MQQLAIRHQFRLDFLDDPKERQRALDYLRVGMYRAMDLKVTDLLKDGVARVIQYGPIEELPKSYYGGYSYRPEREFELRVYTWPVTMQKYQSEHRMMMAPSFRDYETMPAGPQDIAVDDWVHSQDLDQLAAGRNYVFQGKRAFERNLSGWRRVW